MPTLVTTIEDTSPLIIYSDEGGHNGWRAGTSQNDSALDRYSQSSYTITNTLHANASFFFYGNGVQLFGSKRPKHGNYQITIDAWVYAPVSGNATHAEELFQTSLFTTTALKTGYHMVQMTNMGTGLLDLDFLTWQTPIGRPYEELITRTVQDSDSSFKYSPEVAWNTTLPNQGMFAGGSGHQTTTAGATAEFKFEVWSAPTFLLLCSELTCAVGDTVYIYGPVGPNGASYAVQLDEQPPLNLTSYKSSYHPRTMLYQTSGLGGGQHTVKMVSTSDSNSGKTLSIDYAEVFTAPSLQSSPPSSRLSTGTIIGASIGGFFGLVLFGLLLFFYNRSRNRRKYERLSQRQSVTVQDPYIYAPTSATTGRGHNMLSPSSMSSKSQVLHSQSSHNSMNYSSPPSTGWSLPAPVEPLTLEQSDPNVQVLVVPYARDTKRNTTVSLAPASTGAFAVRSSRSQASLPLPPGARLPAPPGPDDTNQPPSYLNHFKS